MAVTLTGFGALYRLYQDRGNQEAADNLSECLQEVSGGIGDKASLTRVVTSVGKCAKVAKTYPLDCFRYVGPDRELRGIHAEGRYNRKLWMRG